MQAIHTIDTVTRATSGLNSNKTHIVFSYESGIKMVVGENGSNNNQRRVTISKLILQALLLLSAMT